MWWNQIAIDSILCIAKLQGVAFRQLGRLFEIKTTLLDEIGSIGNLGRIQGAIGPRLNAIGRGTCFTGSGHVLDGRQLALRFGNKRVDWRQSHCHQCRSLPSPQRKLHFSSASRTAASGSCNNFHLASAGHKHGEPPKGCRARKQPKVCF